MCGLAGLPLWLVSYAWLPFAMAGCDTGTVWGAVVVGEVGALAAGSLGVGLGTIARKRSRPGTPDHRRATRALLVGAAVLAMVLVPNIVGRLWTAQPLRATGAQPHQSLHLTGALKPVP